MLVGVREDVIKQKPVLLNAGRLAVWQLRPRDERDDFSARYCPVRGVKPQAGPAALRPLFTQHAPDDVVEPVFYDAGQLPELAHPVADVAVVAPVAPLTGRAAVDLQPAAGAPAGPQVAFTELAALHGC